MDDFQKQFFLFRQSEWEDYKYHHDSVLQGDLADPVYFDFISFCQYAVIAKKMREGLTQFVEKVTSKGVSFLNFVSRIILMIDRSRRRNSSSPKE